VSGTGDASLIDACLASGGIDALATALVNDAYAGSCASYETASESNAPARAHSTTPDREDESVEPGHSADPLNPRKGHHRPKPTDPMPVEAPPVPKLRPLE
jgi:hypothetical protein